MAASGLKKRLKYLGPFPLTLMIDRGGLSHQLNTHKNTKETNLMYSMWQKKHEKLCKIPGRDVSIEGEISGKDHLHFFLFTS
jgi:hypothetical protein